MNPFDTSGFPPRWHCGNGWTEDPWVGWLHIGSDVVTFMAYYAVPVVVMYFVRSRNDLRFPPIFYGFLAMVFLSCGTVHLIEAGIFWWPAYKLSGLAKIVTAGVSATGVVLLTRIMPTALDLKSGADYAAAVEEKTHAHKELELISNRLTLATKAGGIGVWDYDLVNNVLVWDDDMYRLYGTSAERFSGAYEAWEEGLHPDDKEAEAEKLQRAIRGEEEFDTEFRVIWPEDGSVHYIKAHGTVLRNDSGEPTRMIGVNWDNTNRREHEDALRDAKEKAEEAARAKSDFLANMSHEIRTPMNGIMGMTELLLGTELKKEQRDYLDLVNHSAESLLSVINDILDFSKIEAGKLHLDSHEFDLRDSIGDTLQTLGFRAEEKGLELAYEVQPDVPDRVLGDIGRIRQVLINLIGNAIKFTDEGEVIVDIRVESRTRDHVSLHFLVKDTGIGISREKQDAIFESFTQAESSTTRTHGGTGLGLTISQSLVELMQGRIWVESEPGEGSTFHFTAILGLASGGEEGLRSPPETLYDLPVLVVDDHATNLRILEEMLSNWEMAPTTAASGSEGLEKVAAASESGNPFRLILLDVMMPEMDGLEFARRIRDTYPENPPGVIMLSSAGSPLIPTEISDLGVDRALTKPVKQSDLLDAITRYFGTSIRDEEGTVESDSEPRKVRPMKVLLAEDGRVNQMVAIKLLEDRGHSVVIANDGRIALSILERENFDAILMDVQMPNLDGYGATGMIRQKEEASGEHIPIIAMTANAMKGDREKCIDAGMDDYVAKPIRSLELFSTLEKYGEVAGGTAEEPEETETADEAKATEDTAAEDGDGSCDPEVFDGGRFQESMVEADLMRRLIDIFADECSGCFAKAHQAIEAGDSEALQMAAHSLKGTVGNYCARKSFQALKKLEELARGGDMAGAEDNLVDCEKEVSRLKRAMESFRDRLPPE